MAQPGTLEYLISVATSIAATKNSAEYVKLSDDFVCWDAAVHCANLAGFRINAGIGADWEDVFNSKNTVKQTDPLLNNKHFDHVLAPSLLGFFDGNRIMHMMIYLGNMQAAGNKNDCIGIGSPKGWEILDMSTVRWNDDGTINAEGQNRHDDRITIHHCYFGDRQKF